jgi:hypothetical protein
VPESCRNLDLALVEKTLVDACGNVTAAARSLAVPSVDLRRFVWATPSVADVVFEQVELAIDEAEAVLRKGLRHPDLSKQLQAAIFILRHGEAARRRGWRKGRA